MLTFLLPVFLYRLDWFTKEVIFIFHPFNQNRMVSCWLWNKPQIPLGGIYGSPPAHLFCTLAQLCKSSLPSIRHSSHYHLPQVPRVFLCVLTWIICIYIPGKHFSQTSPFSPMQYVPGSVLYILLKHQTQISIHKYLLTCWSQIFFSLLTSIVFNVCRRQDSRRICMCSSVWNFWCAPLQLNKEFACAIKVNLP